MLLNAHRAGASGPGRPWRIRPARLLLAMVVLLLCGCPRDEAVALEQLAGSEWRLLSGVDGADEVDITLAFESAQRIVGSGGCNRYSAEVAREGGRLSIGPVVATKRGCPGLRGRVEPRFFAALKAVTAMHRDGDQLLLDTPDGTLRFGPEP